MTGYAETSIQNIIENAACIRDSDKTLILVDESTLKVGELFRDFIQTRSGFVEVCMIDKLNNHGQEPPSHVADRMKCYSLILCLTKYSLAHTQARVNAGYAGARFLSMPDFSISFLEEVALGYNFRERFSLTSSLTNLLTEGNTIRVTSSAGTDVSLDISGRKGNCCPGFVVEPGDLGSPPDIEANISPIESLSEGIIVVDGSVTCPAIGKVHEPIVLNIVAGKISSITTRNVNHQEFLAQALEFPGSKKCILAECGIGLNPLATITGNMLTDEGANGCIHFGFGSNHTVGGLNNAGFHLDFVIRSPTLYIDKRLVLRDSEFFL